MQTFIVHVQKPKSIKFLREVDRKNWHMSFLPNTTLDTGEPRLVYSYHRVISGFAARLTSDEVRLMASTKGFLHSHPSQRNPLLTTYTPEFLGLDSRNGIWYDSSLGKGVIVGVLDTGIHPAHPSFTADGMPPPPNDWRGDCDFRESRCNNKLIGAAAFLRGRPTPVDVDHDGHGTHIAGIVAGTFVDRAAVLGNANGTAAGMAPKAQVAVYQVCHKDGCEDSDILAGIDQAIHDRVDVLSISIGSSKIKPFHEDALAIGTFAAVRNGILTIVAAGNDGPEQGKVINAAPWTLTVGASSTDRRIVATVRLGNGTEIDGESANQTSGNLNSTLVSIAFPGFGDQGGSRGCRNDSFNGVDLRGKIVLCETGFDVTNVEKGEHVLQAGGKAMIVLNQKEQGFTTLAEEHVLPAAHVSFSDRLVIEAYISSATNSTPTATIVFKGTQFGARPSPAAASFSSRGPSRMNGGIPKPDVVGPGVNILSAWPPSGGDDGANLYRSSSSTFKFLSGTSMATAHLSGIVALIKSSHPRWSPAAIKSAIMTTADNLDRDGNPIADEFDGGNAGPFALGSGHVNASRATNPGLIYDIHLHRYVHYLCGLGYTDEQVLAITQHQIKCFNFRDTNAEQLNYPAIAVSLGFPSRKIIERRVKNVGEENAVYFAEIEEPEGVKVELSHYKLEFNRHYEKKRFHVVLTTNGTSFSIGKVSSGQLSWVSSKHIVRSPISVIFT
ncbi:subtilisin-like protease 4 [Typha angustifolia]|uniref:subtilisin-like protease 4 n=1 Tax=Typha angustifolia TaxID=59011 RepID=UPI003C2BD4F1